ncbi:MAG: divergent PAP2 family protein [Candidatus Gastranaerophilales bacterium]|nr:divergent PAP2 family protein [Candidatus Gastranaerophilales bacterium]
MYLDIIRNTIANNGYEVISCGILSAFFAQVVKFILFTIKSRKVNFKIFSTTGGMPSSHSAGVMGLSTLVGILQGYDSIIFAVSLGVSLIIMYDAAGLRRAAGKTAACLNRMMEDFYHHDLQSVGGKLKELLGHTPLEVFVGAIFGICFAYLYHWFIIG